jgi:glycopeptide antibiotics resistance protein
MTHAQLTTIGYGFVAFVIVWSLILIPQLITHHARYGQPDLRRVFTTAAVLLYSCLAIAVVFFPLPSAATPALTHAVQLEPFQWISDAGRELRRDRFAESTFFSTKAFQQVLMNVALFVPFGVFARTLWRRGLLSTIALGFAASLAVEVTQLTANFGTAPQVYRIFDVDDLINNTTGAGLGWVVGALLVLLLNVKKRDSASSESVSRERIDFAQLR